MENNDYDTLKYFYIINYNSEFEEELCDMEMKSLFNQVPKKKYLFSNQYVSPSRSPYIKEFISIIYEEDSLEKIVENIKKDKLCYDDFKVCYLKTEDTKISYEERLKSIRSIGLNIEGEADIHNPKVMLGVTNINGRWIFGVYERNDFKWHIHDEKPYTYSNSLSVRVARALVNIAVGNNLDCSLIDPCCGVGTVVIEALSMNINVCGYDINPCIASNAKRNLEFFGYDNVITKGDMRNINKTYDVCIIDLPYGLFTPITLQEQIDIISSARKISKRLVLVTFEDMDKHIINAGFSISDKCCVSKGKFKRYINLCE